MQILVATLIAVLLGLQYLLWIDEDGVRQTYALRISVQAQTETNATLNERNRTLEAEIKDLKTGMTAIEERARTEIGMIRQDETFFRLLERPASRATEYDQPPPPGKPSAPPGPVRSSTPRALASPAKPAANLSTPNGALRTAGSP